MDKINQEEDIVALSSGDEVKCVLRFPFTYEVCVKEVRKRHSEVNVYCHVNRLHILQNVKLWGKGHQRSSVTSIATVFNDNTSNVREGTVKARLLQFRRNVSRHDSYNSG